MDKELYETLNDLHMDLTLYGGCMSFLKDGKLTRISPADWEKYETSALSREGDTGNA